MADYNANIKVNVQASSAEKALDKINDKVSKLAAKASNVTFTDVQAQANLDKTLLTVRNLNDAVSTLRAKLRRIDAPGGEGAGKFADKIRVAATQADRFFDGLTTKGTTALAKSTQGLREQAAAFQFLAANIDPAKARFQDYVQGAQAAQDKLLLSTFKTFEALRKLYGENITGRGVDIEGGKLGAGFFEKLGKDVPRTTSAVKAYYEELVRIRGLVEPSSLAGLGIEQEIIRITNLLRDLGAERKAVERSARGLQPQEVRDAEVARRIALLKSREIQQKKDLQLQNEINTELAEYERLAAEVAQQTKEWANNLDRIARSSRAGVFGSSNQIQSRLQEFRENRASADIARQRSAELLARERRLAGSEYSIGQVPARGELFPGGRTETASPQFRNLLNEQARVRQAASEAIAKSEKTITGFQAQTLRTEQNITAQKRIQQEQDQRSINILRERNQLLLEGFKAEQRVASGTLDPASLRADRLRRIKEGRERQKAFAERTANVTLGAGFPLLFGGGAGAVIGGGLGGALGTGPQALAAQIGLSALGQVFDQFAAKTADLAKAVNPATADIGALSEALGITGTRTEKYIESLIEQGRTQDALLFAQNELNRIVGSEGVANLSRYGEAVVQLNNEWAKLFAEVGAGLAGLFAGPTKSFADALERDRLVRQARREGNITPEQQRGLRPTFETFSGSASSNELLQKTLDEIAAKQKQINEQQAEAEKKALDKNQVDAEAVRIKLKQVDAGYAEIEALKAGNNLLDDKVFKAKEAAIQAEFEAASAQELIDKRTDFNSQLARTKSLYELNAERAKQEAEALEKSAREAERLAGSLAKLQTGLIQESLKAADADVQIVKLRQGTSAANNQELSQLVARQALEEKILFINAQQQISQKERTKREKELVNATYVQQLRNLRSQYEVRKQTLVQLEAARRLSKFTADQEAQQQIQNTLDSFRLAREEEVQFGKTYLKLVSEGLLPAEAERLVNFEKLIANEKRSLDSQIVLVEAALQRAKIEGLVGDELQKQIDKLERLKKLRGELDKPTDPGEGPTNIERLESAIASAKGQLNELTNAANIVKGAAESVGAAFGQAFQSVVSGTETAQEALSNFFKNIGDYFLETANKIIAKLIEIFILEQIVGFISGAAGGANSRGTPGAVAPDGRPYYGPAFADGGYVTTPTRALIGEGGEPEYVIPFSKMGSAAANFAAGARGEDVFGPLRSTSVPFSKTTERLMSERSERETVAALNNPDPLDVRFNSQVINNVEYVTAEEYRKGMTQAAERGRTLTLAALQNSVKTRKRVGIG